MEEEKSGFLKKIGFGRNANYSQHRDDVSNEDRVITGASYQVRYLGYCQVVDKFGTGSDHVEIAIDKVYRESTKKNQKRRMCVRIERDRMLIEDVSTTMSVIDMPLKRISFCSGSKNHPTLYCYITRAEEKNEFHAHVFMCDDVQTARNIITVLGTAFRMAFAKAKLNSKGNENKKMDASSGLTAAANNIKNKALGLSKDDVRPRASSTSRIETSSSPKSKIIAATPPKLLPPPTADGISVRARASTMPSSPNKCSASMFDDFTELARSRSSTSSNDELSKDFTNKAAISGPMNTANLLIDFN
ncbi:uncharacterized protein TRIADDRAFT_57901 [Trichoplax adhaerens]|uniref:PID domain-containing protein n=1 Tax=Trichoplax adhaerens TaxID=10228 RepID=B3S225_TRIAD|nr:hypothetical protein TRIADDRAFT_57901 [Trichoplax adhaerens]EDV23359.1 hypothetical protein TRIADDRAFT_57901 [Trichoplax adhaerens]|eukprot:XP_002114269.1 hypothetical protein TRIADDRAFT_57901 [Trichoplax adhaerens]